MLFIDPFDFSACKHIINSYFDYFISDFCAILFYHITLLIIKVELYLSSTLLYQYYEKNDLLFFFSNGVLLDVLIKVLSAKETSGKDSLFLFHYGKV